MTLAHEAIKNYMPAMVMDVHGEDLPSLHAGDRIRATLVVAADASKLTNVIVVTRGSGVGTGRPTIPAAPGTLLPDVILKTQSDKTIRPSDFRGRVLLVTFIYTRCPLPDFCPRLMRNVQDLRRSSTPGEAVQVHMLSVTIDPNRICLWGTSAGGHLAAVAALALKGMFEGEDNLTHSSTVTCVLDAYGPTKFDVMDAQTDEERPTLQPQAAALLSAPPQAGRGRGGAPQTHDSPTSPESRLVGAPLQTVPDRVRAASPLTYVRAGAPPFLIMHGLADNSVPHGQSVLLYDALAAAGNDVTLRLVDGLPHTFFNRSDLDELAGPFAMTVREHPRGGREQRRGERNGVFTVAREFFRKHLR